MSAPMIFALSDGSSAALRARVSELENNETIYHVFGYVGTSTSGQVAVPAEATIFDIYGDGILDAVAVVADGNQNPTGVNSTNSSSDIVQVTSLDDTGNYVLDSTPTENACLLYYIIIKDKYKNTVDQDSIIESSLVTTAKVQAVLASGDIRNIVLDIVNASPYLAGQLSYDPSSFAILADTGIGEVRVNLGQEEQYLVYNPSAVTTLLNGSPIYASGVDPVYFILTAGLADNTSFFTSAQVLGLATHDIAPLSFGLVTSRGVVRSFNTTNIITGGLTYLGAGILTPIKPLYPNTRWLMGVKLRDGVTDGEFMVTAREVIRKNASRSYSFTSQGIVSGTYWKAGFYDFNANDFSATQASPSVSHGLAGRGYQAHAAIVPSAPGVVVGGGQVGLRVTGILDSENGAPQQAAQTGIITEDITTLTANVYAETSEKWSGSALFELYVVSGTPTSYSLTFNYGYAKYEDASNIDFTVRAFESVWQGNAINDTLDIALLHHKATGWTYAATGFVPGNSDICRKSVDMQLAGNVAAGVSGAYKRVGLDTFIDGNGSEGIIIQVNTGGNNTVQTMDMHMIGVSEELN